MSKNCLRAETDVLTYWLPCTLFPPSVAQSGRGVAREVGRDVLLRPAGLHLPLLRGGLRVREELLRLAELLRRLRQLLVRLRLDFRCVLDDALETRARLGRILPPAPATRISWKQEQR